MHADITLLYTIAKLNIRIFVTMQAKCQQYWPPKGSKVCGDVKITLHKEEQLANYSVRQFFVEQVPVKLSVYSMCSFAITGVWC